MIPLFRGTVSVFLTRASTGDAVVLPSHWRGWLVLALGDPLFAAEVRRIAVDWTGGRGPASDRDVVTRIVGLLEGGAVSMTQSFPKPVAATGGRRAPVKEKPVLIQPLRRPPPRKATPAKRPPRGSAAPASAFRSASSKGTPLVCKGPCEACGQI